VMELVEGRTLHEELEAATMTTARALEILDGVLAGVDAMHATGVGHLDLKPDNVILRRGTGAATLVDFGLSGRTVRKKCGNPLYSAPEVWNDERQPESAFAADAYSFACFAFETLTGRVVFDHEDVFQIIRMHLSHDGLPPAIAELRAYHRMTGRMSHLAVLADCERALGRPEKAIDIYRSAERTSLDSADAVELLIVAAGARRDLGQDEAAVAMLQVRELTADEPWAARLRYAYADALAAVGRADEAREWFARAVDVDADGVTDAAERLLEVDGVVLEDDDEDEDDDHEDDDGDDAADGEDAAEFDGAGVPDGEVQGGHDGAEPADPPGADEPNGGDRTGHGTGGTGEPVDGDGTVPAGGPERSA